MQKVKDAVLEKNRNKFLNFKQLNLPLGQYAITGSGPMGVRGLREINDIDIIVNSELWHALSEKYDVTDENGVRKIVFSEDNIEAMGENSFYTIQKDPDTPAVADRIRNAEIIKGLAFESLEHVIYYKRKMGREKDLKDIALIEAWQQEKSSIL